MGSTIQAVISGIGVSENSVISVLSDFQNEKVFSVSLHGGTTSPQIGDVVLYMDNVITSVIPFGEKFEDDGTPYIYKKWNLAEHNGMLFRLKVNEIAVPGVWDPSEWEELDIVDMICKDFEPNFPYEKWQVVTHDGVIYRALKDFTSHSEFNPEDWEELSQLQILEFTPHRYYHKDSVIWRTDPKSGARILWLAKDNFKAGDDWDQNDWERIRSSDETLMLKNFEPSTSTAEDSTTFTWTYRNPVTDETTTKKYTIITGNALTSFFDTDKTTIQIDNFAWNEPNEIASPGVITSVDPNRENPHYRGSGTTTQMNSVTRLVDGDLYDNTDTNTVWEYRGNSAGGASYTQANTTTPLRWVNTGRPITNEYKETPNYSKVHSDGSDTNVNNHGIVPTPDTYIKYENRQIKYYGENQIDGHTNPDIINLRQLWEDTNLEYLANLKHNGYANGEMIINNGTATAPQWVPFVDKYGQTFDQWRTSVENRIKDLQNRVGAIENAIYNWGNDKNTKIPRGNINVYSGGVGTTGILTRNPGNNTNDLRFQ